jgi:hypothetical protein
MKHIFSISMISAALLFSLIYYVVVEKTGAAATGAEVVFTEASESEYVTKHTISTDSLVFTSTPKNTPIVYYCLIAGNFFDKMTGYGMELKDFLSLTGEEAREARITVRKTNGFSVLNYFTAASENLITGQVYYLIVGEKNAEGEFSSNSIDCIKIQL